MEFSISESFQFANGGLEVGPDIYLVFQLFQVGFAKPTKKLGRKCKMSGFSDSGFNGGKEALFAI
jgi:hypothetical protein